MGKKRVRLNLPKKDETLLRRIIFMKKILIVILFILTSCRCETNFKIVSENKTEEIIDVNSNIWQSQYEYLNINITLRRDDSLTVKNIIVEPTIKTGTFPTFDNYQMITSYGFENKKLVKKKFKEIYTEKEFKNFPIKIRKTNHKDEKVFYSISYTNKEKLKINKYSAKIKVILLDENHNEIIIKRFVNFSGERNCYFSAH